MGIVQLAPQMQAQMSPALLLSGQIQRVSNPRQLGHGGFGEQLVAGILWRDLGAATREIRPDWDLSTPGLRGDWAAGDYSHFHGWDKRSAKPVAAT